MDANSDTKLDSLLAYYVIYPSELEKSQFLKCLPEVTPESTINSLKRVRDRGFTTLHKAVIRSHLSTVQCILSQLSKSHRYELLEIQDGSGFTPIHWAVHFGRRALLKTMLDSVSASNQIRLLTILDEENLIALNVAERHNFPDIADFIRGYQQDAENTLRRNEDDRYDEERLADMQEQIKCLQAEMQTQSKVHQMKLENQRDMSHWLKDQYTELRHEVQSQHIRITDQEKDLQQKSQQISGLTKTVNTLKEELANQKEVIESYNQTLTEDASKMAEQIKQNKAGIAQTKLEMEEEKKETAVEPTTDSYTEAKAEELRPLTPPGEVARDESSDTGIQEVSLVL